MDILNGEIKDREKTISGLKKLTQRIKRFSNIQQLHQGAFSVE
jgi:hypothetical protein